MLSWVSRKLVAKADVEASASATPTVLINAQRIAYMFIEPYLLQR
jgi:hypothetical protein